MTTPEQVLANAAKWIGTSGTDNPFNTWIWGFHCYDENRYPWCASYQSYIFIMDSGMQCTASASAAGFANQFPRIDDSEVRPGDLVIFNWDGRTDTNWSDHIGLVEWFDHGSELFGTIEGNTGWAAGGEVARITRNNNAGYFTAFYRPWYDGSESGGDTGGGGGGQGPGGLSGSGEWQGEVVGFQDTTGSGDDFAGVPGRPMLYVAIGGVGKYRASDIRHGWWDFVDKYDLDDEENGMAGSGSPIDRVQIPDSHILYQTHNLGGGWNDVMRGLVDTGGSGDDFAGDTGIQQDLIRIWREDGGDQPRYNVYS